MAVKSFIVQAPGLNFRLCMENLMVIQVEVIAPEKPLLSKHLQK